jgi:hypothetical protein
VSRLKKVKVVHSPTRDGWRSHAPDLKDFKREGPTLDAVRQLAEDGVRWALNTERVEVKHVVRDTPVPASETTAASSEANTV